MDLTPEDLAKLGVSISLHPGSIAPIAEAAGDHPAARAAVSAAQSALGTMATAMAELKTAVRATAGSGRVSRRNGKTRLEGDIRSVVGDGLRAFSGREGDLYEAASKRFARVARDVDAKRELVLKAVGDAQAEVDRVVRTPHPEGAEIRAYVRSLDGSKRVAFLNQRVMASDDSAVRGVLSAPGYLSGFESEDDALAAVVLVAEQRFAPEAASARDGAREIQAHLERAGSAFATTWAKSARHLKPSNDADRAMSALATGGAA